MHILVPRSLSANGPSGSVAPRESSEREGPLSELNGGIPDFSIACASSSYWEDRSLFVAFYGRPRLTERIKGQLETSSPIEAKAIARLWRQEELRLCERLVGAFSLVVWDTVKRELHLMVDPFGVNTLFFRVEDRSIAISTHTATLRGAYKLEIDAIPDVFNLRLLGGRLSLWEGTFQVTPGRATLIDRTGFESEKKVHRFSYSSKKSELTRAKTTALVTSALRTAFEKRRDEGLADVAIPLSGGIDSSILAALAVRTFPRCTAFTAQIDNFANPELPRAREVAARLGIPLRIVAVSDADVSRLYPWSIEHLEEPPRHFNNFVLIRMLEAITETSETAISGDNATIFGTGASKRIIKVMQKRRLFDHLPQPILDAAAWTLFRTKNDRLINLAETMAHGLPELVQASMTIHRSVREVLALRPHVLTWLPSKDIVDRDYSLEHDVHDTTLLWCYRILARAIFRRNARFSEALGVEFWYPLQDASVMEIASGLPKELRLIQETGEVKPILRSVCADLVGQDVASWSKMGFPTPELAWMTGPLLTHLEASLADSSPMANLFDVAAIRRLPQSATRQILWTLMTLSTVIQQTSQAQDK